MHSIPHHLMAFSIPFEPPAADYPNHLAVGQPERLTLRPAHWLLLGLVLLCLLPRVWMVRRIPSICPDGVLYINAARALEVGNFGAAFQEMSLNIYPVILMLLHRVGMPWDLAAVTWDVVISSLVVLPLYGWVRRQFDDRLAPVACLLYVVHPKFIEWSPEVMPRPDLLVPVYAFHLLVVVRRHGGAGLVFRGGGSGRHLGRVDADRRPVSLGAVCVMDLLAFVGVAHGAATACVRCGGVVRGGVSSAVAGGESGLGLRRTGWDGPKAQSLATGGAVAAIHADKRLGDRRRRHRPAAQRSLKRMLHVYFPDAYRGLSPIFALLMFGGMWGWRRVRRGATINLRSTRRW